MHADAGIGVDALALERMEALEGLQKLERIQLLVEKPTNQETIPALGVWLWVEVFFLNFELNPFFWIKSVVFLDSVFIKKLCIFLVP